MIYCRFCFANGINQLPKQIRLDILQLDLSRIIFECLAKQHFTGRNSPGKHINISKLSQHICIINIKTQQPLKSSHRIATLAQFTAMLYACSDELHQYYVSGRGLLDD
ncbi:MAG: VanZ family protein, partial [Spirochaetales bacterium]|nr:VanZ family protein [Spirochaetales bacterium]